MELDEYPELRAKLEQAKVLDGLHLDLIPPRDRERVVLAVATAARRLAGELAKEPQDKLGESFIEGLLDLDAKLGSPSWSDQHREARELPSTGYDPKAI